MTASLKPFVFAWQFLTAIPLSRELHKPAPEELAGSMFWYPFVGILIGALLAVTDLLLAPWLSREVTVTLLIVLLVGVTRGLHQDGLADTLDGLAGGRTSSDRLTIMRDPRIGALGATGLFLSLIMRYSALVSLPEALRVPILLCMPAIGRWGMVFSAYGAIYARAEGGLAAPFLAHLSRRHVVGATVVVGAVMVWSYGATTALAALIIGGIVSRLTTLFCHYYFGGITGDTLGATNEVVEISFLLLMPLLTSLS
ncbi:MAG TPA: adenosylcobinamide-GDP ribazoletransferase [Nitrospira sp.]|nr:adenosylcobinamide-GDP ribazoletransferase [Nitrospira sp.]